MPPRLSRHGLAKLSTAYAGAMFGIYWIPVRAIGEAGFTGVWAGLVFNAVPLTLVLPLVLWRWRHFIPGRPRFHLTGLLIGLSLVTYANAFLYTEVIRTIVLFYLTPIWGFLLARILTGRAITPVRWLSMGLALLGLLTMFGAQDALPLPRNAGDWMALASGLLWALASLMLLTDRDEPVNYGLSFFLWGTIVGAGMAFGTEALGLVPSVDWSRLPALLPWMVPLAVIVILPAGFATVFGPSQLNPGVAGLLFMTEVSVGTVTAALLAGEPFGLREVAGVVLISGAGLLEPVGELRRARRQGPSEDRIVDR